jgi:hypothetical protein
MPLFADGAQSAIRGLTKRGEEKSSLTLHTASLAFWPLATVLDSSSVARRRVGRGLEKRRKPGIVKNLDSIPALRFLRNSVKLPS